MIVTSYVSHLSVAMLLADTVGAWFSQYIYLFTVLAFPNVSVATTVTVFSSPSVKVMLVLHVPSAPTSISVPFTVKLASSVCASVTVPFTVYVLLFVYVGFSSVVPAGVVTVRFGAVLSN